MFTSAASTNALANSHLSLVGGVDYNVESYSSRPLGLASETKGGLGFAGGALVSVDMIEFGGIYLAKKFVTKVATVESTTDLNMIRIPGSIRLGRGSMTFAFGGFYDLPVTSGAESDYGVMAGPRFGHHVFLDIRFSYGFKNPNSKDILALVGIALGKGK